MLSEWRRFTRGRAGNGPGVPKEHQAGLFETVQQTVDDTRLTRRPPKAERLESAADLVAVGAPIAQDQENEGLRVTAEAGRVAVKRLASGC